MRLRKRAKIRAFTPDRTTYLCYHARRCRGHRAAARYSLCEDAAGNASSLSDYLPLRALRTARDDPAYPRRSIVKALYLSISISRDLLERGESKVQKTDPSKENVNAFSEGGLEIRGSPRGALLLRPACARPLAGPRIASAGYLPSRLLHSTSPRLALPSCLLLVDCTT